MTEILRLNGAVKKEPVIDAWFNRQPAELSVLAQTWFNTMRECGEDVCELIHDGFPTVCIGDAPFAYVGALKDHVNAGFFYGAYLNDPAGLLEGTGKHMRHVKPRTNASIDPVPLKNLIIAAYLDLKARLANR